MFALTLVALFACQDPAPKPAPPKPEAKQAAKAATRHVEVWDDKTAKAKVKEFQKALKTKNASMVVRKRALDGLQPGANKLLVRPLQKFIENDSSVVLKKQAIAMLGDQPDKNARGVILKLLEDDKMTANPQVHGGLIRSLARAGYTGKDWKVIADVFESDYDTARVPVHEAVLDLVTKHKEQQAIPLLLRNLDEPAAGNVEAADNPPAEYWKARWHSWAVWKNKVKEALFVITGQRFSTAAEAKVWLEKNPLPKKSRKRRKR